MKLDWKEKILIQGEKPPENPLEEEFIASLGDPVESLSWTWNGDTFFSPRFRSRSMRIRNRLYRANLPGHPDSCRLSR